MANHLSSKHYLHKSIIWELGLLTHYLQAEGKKRTGIQLIRVSDANGNVYQRYYDFDKGEFAANPNKEMPREELKKYRGLRNKDISSSIASLTYTSSIKGEEELWEKVQQQFEDLSPEQAAETQSVLKQLTVTNSGWNLGMQLLGEEVALGFEDGLKSIETNIDKGLSATGTALNTLWSSVNNNKPLKNGIILAGSLMGSVASAVKASSILGGGVEGLATRALITGVGLEFTAVALGGLFVGAAIKTFVLPQVKAWMETESEDEGLQGELQRLMERQQGTRQKQLIKDLTDDNKQIQTAFAEVDTFKDGLAFIAVEKTADKKEEVRRNTSNEDEKSIWDKLNIAKTAREVFDQAFAQQDGDDTKKFLFTKVKNNDLLVDDIQQVEELEAKLNSLEKTLSTREQTIGELNFDPKDQTPTQIRKQINTMRQAIDAKKIELYGAMLNEAELVRDAKSRHDFAMSQNPNSMIGQKKLDIPFQESKLDVKLSKVRKELDQQRINIGEEIRKTKRIPLPSDINNYETGAREYEILKGQSEKLSQAQKDFEPYADFAQLDNALNQNPEIKQLEKELNKSYEQQAQRDNKGKIVELNEYNGRLRIQGFNKISSTKLQLIAQMPETQNISLPNGLSLDSLTARDYRKLTSDYELLQDKIQRGLVAQQKMNQYRPFATIMEEVESSPELKSLTRQVEKLEQQAIEAQQKLDNLSLDYKAKIEQLVGEKSATPEEIQESTQSVPLTQNTPANP